MNRMATFCCCKISFLGPRLLRCSFSLTAHRGGAVLNTHLAIVGESGCPTAVGRSCMVMFSRAFGSSSRNRLK